METLNKNWPLSNAFIKINLVGRGTFILVCNYLLQLHLGHLQTAFFCLVILKLLQASKTKILKTSTLKILENVTLIIMNHYPRDKYG